MSAVIDLFRYQSEADVRVVVIEGEPWFVAADIAGVLGYSATEAMTRSLDADEKGMHSLHTPGGEQQMSVVSESGLLGDPQIRVTPKGLERLRDVMASQALEVVP